jgi:hypothetical protein
MIAAVVETSITGGVAVALFVFGAPFERLQARPTAAATISAVNKLRLRTLREFISSFFSSDR